MKVKSAHSVIRVRGCSAALAALDMNDKKSCVARGFSPCLTTGSNESNRVPKKKSRPTQKRAADFGVFGSRILKDKSS